MTTVVNLKPLLDRKQWEMCNYAPASAGTGAFIVSSNLADQYQYFITSNTSAYLYDPLADGWITLPSPGLAGTFGAGSCGVRHTHGPRSFPTAGTTTTLTTNLNLQRSLKGYICRIIAGPNAGTDAIIASNTCGPNSVITFQSALGTAITTASEFILMTGRVFVMNGGTVGTGSFKYYDMATNTWNNASNTGLPATLGTDGKLVATLGYLTNFDVGTASAGTSTTLTDASKTWGVNTWTNYQLRIIAGTGAGQFRVIASNTVNALTLASAFTITPDATSQYAIEGNDDTIYYLGNNSVTLYRYSVYGNSWTTMAPSTARAAAPVAGMNACWVWGVSDASWKNPLNYLNGQYIYSFRGSSTVVDRYNITTNAWENDIPYSPKSETFSSGTSWNYDDGDYIYSMITNIGRLIRYNIALQRSEPCSQLWYAQGTAVLGDRLFDAVYTDGDTTLRWVYYITSSQNTLFRMLLF